MRNFTVVGLLCATLQLGGCAWPWWGSVENRGCDVQFKQGSRWVIRGIDIPINHPLVGTVRIANVDYTGPDYANISETIRILDQARLGYCSLTTSKNFALISPTVRDETFKKAAASYDAITNFGIGLQKAKTPQDGRAAQQTAAKVIPDVVPPSPGAFIDSEARIAVADLGTALHSLRTQVTELTQGLDEVRRSGAKRVKVTGFAPNGSALLAEQRNAILSEVGKAITAVPASRTPTVLLIGYADSTGMQANNTELALRRAANVAEFLRRHDFGRDFHTEVTSGGVSSQARGELARRVDIVVSRKPVVWAIG